MPKKETLARSGLVTGSNVVAPPTILVRPGATVTWTGAGGKKIKIQQLPPGCVPRSSGRVFVPQFTTEIRGKIPLGREEYKAVLEGDPRNTDDDGIPRIENEPGL